MRDTTQYLIHGSKYSRLASRMLFNTIGGNLQNKDDSLKRIYCADEGKLLNQRDQSGAEALIVAYLCRDGNYRALFKNGIKIHVFVALHVFADVWAIEMEKEGLDIQCNIDELLVTDIPLLKDNPWWKPLDNLIQDSDEWDPERRYYYIAKQIAHSGNYGATHFMLALNTLEKSRGRIVLSTKDSKKFLEMYHTLFPEIQDDFQAFVRYTVEETGVLYNLLGEPIHITGVRHGDQAKSYWKEWYSAIPQSSVAMITRRAVIRMQEFIDSTGVDWDILPGDTHDSFLVQSPENEYEQCQKVMKEFIEPKLTNFKGEEFQMKSAGASGYNWSKYHKVDNIHGLKKVEI